MTIYGRDGDSLMTKFRKKLQPEMRPDSVRFLFSKMFSIIFLSFLKHFF